jgi:hypothetical protein
MQERTLATPDRAGTVIGRTEVIEDADIKTSRKESVKTVALEQGDEAGEIRRRFRAVASAEQRQRR